MKPTEIEKPIFQLFIQLVEKLYGQIPCLIREQSERAK